MTLPVTDRIAGPYSCNGVVVAFDFAFKVFAASNIRVVKTLAAGGETVLVLDSDYTVTLNADQENDPGGTVTTTTAFVTGFILTIDGSLTYGQTAELTNLGAFFPKVIETALDRIVILIQQLKRLMDRSLKFSVSDSISGTELPPAAARAGRVLGFDANGNLTTHGVTTTVYGQVVEQFTATAGQTVFNLANAYVPGVNAVAVFQNGLRLRGAGTDYSETSANVVTLIGGATLADEIDVVIGQESAASASLASAVSYVQAGAGAISRSGQDKMRDIVSVLDYGIVANDSSTEARAANDLAARKLFGPTANGGDNTRTGLVFFPNYGDDVYYFSDVLPLRDGTDLEGNNASLDFLKTVYGGTPDNSNGFLYMIRNCKVRNFKLINVDCDGGGAAYNSGSVIKIGNRHLEGSYFQPAYDSDDATPKGNCTISNVKLVSNNPWSPIIKMFGGLENVTLDHVTCDGLGVVVDILDYEYGFYDNVGDSSTWPSSHARNLRITNFVGENNAGGATSACISLKGVYNATLEGIIGRNVGVVISMGTGEAANALPGTPDVAGIKHNVRINNVVGQDLTSNTGILINGLTVWSGFRAALATQTQADVEFETVDLCSYDVSDFTLDGGGVACSGYSVNLSHGYITNSGDHGIVDNGVRNFVCDDVTVLDSVGIGLSSSASISFPAAWNDRRTVIKNSEFSGNLVGNNFARPCNVILENNVYGYNNEATGGFTVTGEAGSITSVTVDGTEILVGPGTDVPAGASTTITAAALAVAINAYTATSTYTAVSVANRVLVSAPVVSGDATAYNGLVVLPAGTGGMTFSLIKNLSGGKTETAQQQSVSVSAFASGSSITVRNCDTRKALDVAYRNITTTGDTKHVLENNRGNVTFSGVWRTPGSYTGTMVGLDAVVTGTINFKQRPDGQVSIHVPDLTGTSNAAGKTITGSLPVNMRPATTRYGMCSVVSGGAVATANVTMSTTGVITFVNETGGSFSSSGTWTVRPFTLTYLPT